MCAALAVLYGLALALPATRSFFDLAAPSLGMLCTAAVAAALSIGALAAAGFTPGSGAPAQE